MRALPVVFALALAACASARGTSPPESPEPVALAAAEPGSAGDPNASGAEPPMSSPSEPAGTPGGPPAWRVVDHGVAVPDEWRSCAADGECSLVGTTCCDHCNGGKSVAVNAKHAKDVEAKYPKSCQGVACTERGCFARPACDSGRCVMQWPDVGP